MNRLTIIMPVYNGEKFMREALDSLLNQTFKDFELWIVDDASTDNTNEVLTEYHDPRIRRYRNDVNKGRDFIVNHFIRTIETPYFTITDADDVSHPSRLMKQIALLDGDKDLLMCGTSYFTMDIEGYTGHRVTLPFDYNVILKNMELHAQFHGPTTVMRKELTAIFNPLYRLNYFGAFADADLCARIVSAGKAINLSEPLYFYRIVEGSMSRTNLTPASLNYYKLISWLYQQRLQSKMDAADSNDSSMVDHYILEMTAHYDESAFYRHLAFTTLYWRLPVLAMKNAWKSFVLRPWRLKGALTLSYIVLKGSLLFIKQRIIRVHYRNFL